MKSTKQTVKPAIRFATPQEIANAKAKKIATRTNEIGQNVSSGVRLGFGCLNAFAHGLIGKDYNPLPAKATPKNIWVVVDGVVMEVPADAVEPASLPAAA